MWSVSLPFDARPDDTPCRKSGNLRRMKRFALSFAAILLVLFAAQLTPWAQHWLVEPWTSGNSFGSIAIIRSRRSRWKSAMKPLCTNSQLSRRKGWQLVSCTGEPIAARTCVMNSGDST